MKKNQKTKSDYSPQNPIICEEMDRFTTSISRLIFRGLYSQNALAKVVNIVSYAETEYNLLGKLQAIKREIESLKIPISKYVFEDQSTLYTVSDIGELISVSSD